MDDTFEFELIILIKKNEVVQMAKTCKECGTENPNNAEF